MIEIKEDIWKYRAPGHWIGVTSNHSRKSSGENVMGKGIAREAALLFPDLPKRFGDLIKEQGITKEKFGWSTFWFPEYHCFTFNVKYTWQLLADLELIEYSCHELKQHMQENKNDKYYLAAPGSGAGGLDYETQVKPLLASFFNNTDRLIIGRK